MYKAICMLLIVAIIPNALIAGNITWLENHQQRSSTYSTMQAQAAKQVILNQLVKHGVMSDAQALNSKYRSIKIKISTNPMRPGAWVYLYSSSLLTFKIWFLPLSSDLTRSVGLLNKHPAFTSAAKSIDPTPTCPDPSLKALVFLPEYSSNNLSPEDPNSLPYMDKKMYNIVQYVKKIYPQSTKVFFGYGDDRPKSSATRQNFLNVISCPSLRFIFHVGGEDTNPDNAIYAGTAFWTADPSENPVTSADFKKYAVSSNLQTSIFATCHFFTNNTKDAICPLLANQSSFPNMKAYSAGITSLPIPSAMATYECLSNNPDKISNDALQKCVAEYEPLANNSQSNKIYVINGVDKKIDINGSTTKTVELNVRDIIMLNSKDGPFSLIYQGEKLSFCDNSKKTLSQPNEVLVSQHGSDKQPCLYEIVNDLPLAERPDTGSGVRYGFHDFDDSKQPEACLVVQSNFKADITASGTGVCASVPPTLSFTKNGDFDGDTYQPVADAASKAKQNNVDHISLNYSKGKFDRLFGYHYTGKWNNIILSNVLNLPPNCNITLDDTNTVLDISGDGAVVRLSITDK